MKSKLQRREEIIKSRMEINEIENRKTVKIKESKFEIDQISLN